jgi:hypothetical protein
MILDLGNLEGGELGLVMDKEYVKKTTFLLL